MDASTVASRWPAGWGLTRVEWLLGLTVLLFVGLLVHPYRTQQASRYALTAAVVEHGTIVLDDYENVLGRDRAVRDGHIYSDKGPGQPLLMVPFFALGKAAGVEDASTLRVEGNLGLWWVTLWSAALPGAALAVMMYRRTSRYHCPGALLASVSTYAGTLLLPFSALLFGHVLAAALLFGSFMLLSGDRPHLAVAGLLVGMSVAVEYTTVAGVLVLAVYAFTRHRSRALTWVAGGLPVAVGLAIYNAAAFGNPFTVSYQYSAFHEVTNTSRDVFAMFTSGTLENAGRLLFHGRGLAVATPVVIVGLAGAVSKLRRDRDPDSIMALAMFVAFLWIPLLWANPWGGDSPGARYLTPALPFLAVPILWAWQRWRKLTIFTAALSALTMLTATVTNPLLPRDTINGLNSWLQQLFKGEVVGTLFTVGIGEIGWLAQVGLIAVSVVLLVTSHRQRCAQVGTP